MLQQSQPEVWLRGPLPAIPFLVQPIAHALLQATEEIQALMKDFPDDLLWTRPAGCAAAGFHLQHLAGVLDRLFTYAKGEALTPQQMTFLKAEGQPAQGQLTTGALVAAFATQVERSLDYLKTIKDGQLTQPRGVGRAQLPSTVIGLLTHAAEHTMRHNGQLLVTVKVLLANPDVFEY